MFRPRLVRLRRFVGSPITQLVVGLILVGTGLSDVVADFENTRKSFRIGTYHGVIVLGLLQVLQNLPPMVDGFNRWFDATEKKEESKI